MKSKYFPYILILFIFVAFFSLGQDIKAQHNCIQAFCGDGTCDNDPDPLLIDCTGYCQEGWGCDCQTECVSGLYCVNDTCLSCVGEGMGCIIASCCSGLGLNCEGSPGHEICVKVCAIEGEGCETLDCCTGMGLDCQGSPGHRTCVSEGEEEEEEEEEEEPGLVSSGISIDNPLDSASLDELVENITNFIFWIAIALAPLMIIIGAFFLLTAGGDPKRVDTAKKIILYTIIGFVIIMFAKGLVSLLQSLL